MKWLQWKLKKESGAPNSRVALWSGWLEPEQALILIEQLRVMQNAFRAAVGEETEET